MLDETENGSANLLVKLPENSNEPEISFDMFIFFIPNHMDGQVISVENCYFHKIF